jgi:heptosyltransferase-1
MKKDIKKIAIVRLSALGDIINSAVVLQFIKQFYPDVTIEWICEEVFSSLLKSHPLITQVHTVHLKKLKKSKSFQELGLTIKYLKNLGEYDVVIDMQGLLKSAIVARVVSKNVHGFDKNSSREGLSALLYNTTSSISYDTNIVQRNCFVVADALGFQIDDEMLLNKERVFPFTPYKLQQKRDNIALVIGASWPSKKYPKELVRQICENLDAQFYVIWGNEEEYKEASFIAANNQNIEVAPKLTLNELVGYISSMDLVIGNDTGPTHLAWAQNIPSITLFGPTSTRMIYETPQNIGIESSSKVDILHIDKEDFSIKDIDIDEIVTQAKNLLKREDIKDAKDS